MTPGLPTAAFLDRDGTIIVDQDFLARPEEIVLLPGAARAIGMLNASGVPVIVVTNQSGIARGRITPAEYEAVRLRLDEMLAAEGARVDATYHCPHHPDFSGPCDCRKPGTAMYAWAMRDLALPPSGALFIGDRRRDLEPARSFGGRGILIESPVTSESDRRYAAREFELAPSLLAAVERVLADSGARRP